MPRKKSPLEPTVRRKRAYEMGGLSNVQPAPDPIRAIENEALRDLSNEYRMLRIEEMISKKKKQLTNVPNPSSNIQLQKANLDMFKTMMDIAKSSQPAQGPDKSIEYAKLIASVYGDMMKNQSKGGPSFFESMLMDPTLYARAQNLGVFSGQGGEKDQNQFSVEIEKLRGERDMQNRKFDLELQKSRLDAENGRFKLETVIRALSPFMAIYGDGLANKARDVGRATLGNKPSPQSHGPNPYAGNEELAEVNIVCDCGYNKALLLPNPPPSEVACPNCRKLLNVGSSIPTEEEIVNEWRNEEVFR